MRTHSALPLLGITLFTAACATAPAPAPSRPAVSGPVRTGWVAPTRNEVECEGMLTGGPYTEPRNPPVALAIIIPPLDGVPQGMAGMPIQVRLAVDQHGAVVADSTRLDPAIPDRRYDRDFRASLARYRFHPAVVEGCAVPAWTSFVVTLPSRTR